MTNILLDEIDERTLSIEKKIEQLEQSTQKVAYQLIAARAVIREFVYPNAIMTPSQKEAWERWLEANQ